ncbi:MAG TPA: hypothetical protein VEV16_09320, partial [Daejeonella sp.]|nr:hypothetical protein [Daejeonella sp.]
QSQSGNSMTGYTTNNYSVGAFGGLSFFISKRFAFEADLLSANVGYSKSTNKQSDPLQGKFKTETTSFNLSTSGSINNLGFKIYFLF